ncbi:hypothetical protein [Ornithinimicrobium kibberense]|uniref:hypothetical protein n=1 Tax=Ornithinimicrobium kibberense TaxID=282060 RepID=UPI00360858DC
MASVAGQAFSRIPVLGRPAGPAGFPSGTELVVSHAGPRTMATRAADLPPGASRRSPSLPTESQVRAAGRLPLRILPGRH